jgi:hypothetical protein
MKFIAGTIITLVEKTVADKFPEVPGDVLLVSYVIRIRR